MDSFATCVSIALQYGVPMEVLIDKFKHTSFQPAGFTGYAPVPSASSLLDYAFKGMAYTYPMQELDLIAAQFTQA